MKCFTDVLTTTNEVSPIFRGITRIEKHMKSNPPELLFVRRRRTTIVRVVHSTARDHHRPLPLAFRKADGQLSPPWLIQHPSLECEHHLDVLFRLESIPTDATLSNRQSCRSDHDHHHHSLIGYRSA